jgi:hypothetical protein
MNDDITAALLAALARLAVFRRRRYNTNVKQKAGRKIKKPGKYGISICSVFDLSDARQVPACVFFSLMLTI